MLCGVAFFLWSALILLGAAACILQASELLRESHHYLTGSFMPSTAGRQLWDGNDSSFGPPDNGSFPPPDGSTLGSDHGGIPQPDENDSHIAPPGYVDHPPSEHATSPLLDWVNQIAGFIFVIGDCLMVFVYYSCFIKPTADKYIPRNAIIPQDLKGQWAHGTFDCSGDCGTFWCFACCQPCAVADMWYRAGWLHILLEGMQCGMAGWQWFAGVCGFCVMVDFAGCCFPCIMAALRGGVGFVDGGDGGSDDLVPLKKMFGMQQGGWGDFFVDCCCWFYCDPCIGTQEYRQIMAALNRGPLVVAQPSAVVVAGNLVGDPVTVGVPEYQMQPKAA